MIWQSTTANPKVFCLFEIQHPHLIYQNLCLSVMCQYQYVVAGHHPINIKGKKQYPPSFSKVFLVEPILCHNDIFRGWVDDNQRLSDLLKILKMRNSDLPLEDQKGFLWE